MDKAKVATALSLCAIAVALLGGCTDNTEDGTLGANLRRDTAGAEVAPTAAFVECHYSTQEMWPANWTCADDAVVYVDGKLVED